MGQTFIDKYSLLHFAVGIIAYFFYIPLPVWIIIHILFEFVENTEYGIYFNNKYFKWFWPGGKDEPDNVINSVGDTVFAILGWVVAYALDYVWTRKSK